MANMSNYRIWVQINGMFKSINQHWTKSQFATMSNSAVDIWDCTHTSLLLQLYNGLLGSNDMVTIIWYSPTESYLAATTSADHGIGLFDT
eukprot:358902-Ditylum_brightwellii.AAC.1